MDTSLSGIFRLLRNFWLGDEGLSAFLVLLFFALFLGPFIDSLLIRLLTSLLLSLVMVVGVITMSQRPEVRFLAGVVAFAAIVLRWLTHMVPTDAIQRWSSLASLGFMVLLTMGTLFKVFKDDKPVTGHRIMGAIAAYLLFGVTWSILYNLLDHVLPHAFSVSGGDSGSELQEKITYFSFVTLTTLGYGDITPTHDVSRMFAVMEALVGQLYPATLLARLISLEVAHRNNNRVGSPP